jgi:hypothetical protein
MTNDDRAVKRVTIGGMIAELEADIEANRAADIRLKIWKQLFDGASEYEKINMLALALKELGGFSAKEVDSMLNPLAKQQTPTTT